MSYPASIYSPTTLTDGVDYPQAAHINTPNGELVLIETELGTDPAGSAADVKTRLAVSLADDGDLRLTGSSTLTISSGVITATNNLHKVDTEAAAASDNLDTINGGADGYVLVLSLANAARLVTIGHNTGNVLCMGGRSITLTGDSDYALLVYSSALSKWRCMSTASGLNLAVTTVTDIYQVLVSDYTVVCNKATAFTVTLPATSIGQIFQIKSIGAGAVTVVGNPGTDTIDGDLSVVLAQWDNLTVQCRAANTWIIL